MVDSIKHCSHNQTLQVDHLEVAVSVGRMLKTIINSVKIDIEFNTFYLYPRSQDYNKVKTLVLIFCENISAHF